MTTMLTPAAEFSYSAEVTALFHDLRHAGVLPLRASTRVVNVGTPTQGAAATWQVDLPAQGTMQARFQAYGCPHFLAACEALARWLEVHVVTDLPRWQWRELETHLHVPAAKRSRLLLLDEVMQQLVRT